MLWRRPDLVFLTFALAFGILVATVTQPLSGGDERDHFARAYQIALGALFTVKNPSGEIGFGAMFPNSLAQDMEALSHVAFTNPNRRAFLDHLDDPAPFGDPVWVDLNNAASYGTGAYVPHILGIEIGRLFSASTLVQLYLARIVGLLVYVLLIAIAIRRTPSHPWIIAACGLIPSALGQAATVNADGFTIALTFFVMATTLRIAAHPQTFSTRTYLELAAAGALLGLGKPPYMLMVLLLAVPAWRFQQRLLKPSIAIVALTGTLSMLWASYQATHSIPQDDLRRWLIGAVGYAFHDLAPQKQLIYLLTHPLSFAAAIARTFWTEGWEGFRDLIGHMGATWFVPNILVATFLVLLALATHQRALKDELSLDFIMRGWMLVVVATIGLAVLVVAYTNWNAYMAPRIDAVPSRYLFPILPALLIALAPARPKSEGKITQICAIALSVGIAIVLIITAVLLARWHLTGAPLFFKH